ncbi:MAG: hypothetical protein FWG18_00400 [Alphaproteobacteria bacterium]|nr:hypothetical protein [Alphaproteobacteria bacterium]
MLQALLALSIIIAFMPFLVRKMSGAELSAKMAATTAQIESASRAASEYIRDNSDQLPYGVALFEHDKFVDALEPYGLPLGFVARTPFEQNISMVTIKNEEEAIAFIAIAPGKMSHAARAELSVRIGFWASEFDAEDKVLRGATAGWVLEPDAFGWKPNQNAIYVRASGASEFSEMLARRARNINDNKFHTDLNMGGYDIRAANNIAAREGNFKNVLAGDFVLSGIEDGRKMRNRFGELNIRRATFNESLNVTKGVLNVKNLSTPTIAKYGEPPNLNTDTLSVYDFTMAAGRTAFAGPLVWDIRENAVLENVTLDTERLEVSGFINAARGQDVFIDEYEFTYSAKSGIEADYIAATNLTLRDQTSSALLAGGTGPVIIDIRLSGVTVLPDAEIADINNDGILIISSIDDASGATTGCRNIIGNLGASYTYNSKSLSQNIVCRYVFWQRLERRIDLKKCLLEGKSGC